MSNRGSAAVAKRDVANQQNDGETTNVTKLGDLYKKVPLNLRIRRDIKERIEQDVIPLWKMVAEVKGQDPELIDVTYVVERILDGETLGELATWSLEEFPRSEDGKKRLRTEITARVKAERDTK